MLQVLLLLVLAATQYPFSSLVFAQPLQQPELSVIDNAQQIRLPSNFNRVDFYLITVDVGNHVWDNFGHTALRVVDEESNSDLVFNWGLFDASVGNVVFAANFLRGIMDYQLGISPTAWELSRYEREQRTVWQDKINLTNAQKEILYKRLAWNMREENIVYAYDYFFDNCTTRVRDYLNEALGGEIFDQTRAFTQRSFRDEVQLHYASLPPIAFSLNVLMNSRIDRNMTQWEHMFLPWQLRQKIAPLVSDVSAGGQPLNLLSEQQILMQFESPERFPNAYYYAVYLFLSLVALMFCLQRISIYTLSSTPGYTLKAPGISFRVLGLAGVLIGLAGGIYGLMMSLGWLFSGHLDLHHNVNLLLFWPTDLIGAFIALRWLFLGKAVTVSSGKFQLINVYLLVHLLAIFVYLILGIFGLVEQRISSLMIFVIPCLVIFTIVVWTAGIRPVRTIRFN